MVTWVRCAGGAVNACVVHNLGAHHGFGRTLTYIGTRERLPLQPLLSGDKRTRRVRDHRAELVDGRRVPEGDRRRFRIVGIAPFPGADDVPFNAFWKVKPVNE
jgi:hypothetical protein